MSNNLINPSTQARPDNDDQIDTNSAATGEQPVNNNADGRQSRLSFFTKVLTFTKQIRAARDTDQAMLDVTGQICDLFDCEWFVLYAVSDDYATIIPRHNTGPGAAKDQTLPISDHSVAGYVALHRRLVCIRDVYDDAELASLAPALRFSREGDLRTGQRTRQMLVAPLLDAQGNTLLGVLQLANSRSGRFFRSVAAEGLKELCAALATVLRQRLKPPPGLRSKYDSLMTDEVLSPSEFERASSTATTRGCDIEQVLVDEYHVRLSALGAALAKFYGVPYEPFRADRVKPADLLKNLKREFVEYNGWLLIEHEQDALVILALDPEKVKHSRIVNNIFPKAKVEFRVTTNVEFKLTVDSFFGGLADSGAVSALLSVMKEQDDEASHAAVDASAVDDHELVRLVNQIIVDAHRQGTSDIHIEPGTGSDKTLVRFRKDGSARPIWRRSRKWTLCSTNTARKFVRPRRARRKPRPGKNRFAGCGPSAMRTARAASPCTTRLAAGSATRATRAASACMS